MTIRIPLPSDTRRQRAGVLAVLVLGVVAAGLMIALMSAGRGSSRRPAGTAERLRSARPSGDPALADDAAGWAWFPPVTYSYLIALALALTAASLVSVGVVHQERFMFPIAAVWFGAALIAARDGRWWAIAGGVGFGILGLVAGFSAFRFGLPHPDSVADFAPAIAALTGSVCAIGFGAAAVERRIRGAEGETRSGIAILAGAVLLVLVLSIASVLATVTGREAVSASERADATPVVMHDIRFEPKTLAATAGTSLRVVVRNDDAILHTFTVPEAGVNVDIGPGSEKLVVVRLPAAGDYAYLCTVPGHGAMRGTITAPPR